MPGSDARQARPVYTCPPLETLFDQADPAARPLPAGLGALYGGALDLPAPGLYANFVASIDGVAALGPEHPSSGSAISGREPADRFVMGLLRACADAVLIGAGPLRAGLAARPELVVATASGHLPADHPALEAGAVIATTTAGARRLTGRLPGTCTILPLGDGDSVDPGTLVAAVRARGHTTILTEAGPRLIGRLVDQTLLDELFLTLAPVLAGRGETPRPGLLAGLELLPARRETGELLSVRRQASVLFLRYRLRSRNQRHVSVG
jgi:riboflavin biosynthesis pyrimidine reductase